jgi:hypothetical protein
MSNLAPSAVEHSLQSDIAPLLQTHGGAGGLVSEKVTDASLELPSDPSASNITSQASRNLGLENAMKAAAEFKDSHESGEPDDVQKQKAAKMAGAFDRMQPQPQAYNEVDTMYLSLKRMMETIAKMLKNLFNRGKGTDEPSPGSSGFGPEFDDIMAKMEKSMNGMDDHIKDLKKEADLAADGGSGPAGPGQVSTPGAPGKS